MVVPKDSPRPRLCDSFPGHSGVVLPNAELALLLASPVDMSIGAGVEVEGSTLALAASCPTQKSQSTQPSTVPALPQLTTETGEMRSCEIPTKENTNIATEHTCCTMTVESDTRGQKS